MAVSDVTEKNLLEQNFCNRTDDPKLIPYS